MKRHFIIICFILLFLNGGSNCRAQSQYSPIISKMENSLFNLDYSNQTDEARLKRIEETVYGKSSSGSASERVSKLSKDLQADLIGKEIKPKKDSFADEDDEFKEDIPKEDVSVNYPVVNNLEKSVFNKEFRGLDINQRLTKLEQQIFKKNYTDDLNSRVERLKTAVMPKKTINQDDDYESLYYPDDSLSMQTPQFQDFNYRSPFDEQIPEYNRNNSVLDGYSGDSDILVSLASLEKSVLKKSFPNDTTSNRLIRLELSLFSSTFIDDDPQTRLDRVSSAYQAKKTSSKYDNNKFSKHISTAMQLGAILLMVLAVVL